MPERTGIVRSVEIKGKGGVSRFGAGSARLGKALSGSKVHSAKGRSAAATGAGWSLASAWLTGSTEPRSATVAAIVLENRALLPLSRSAPNVAASAIINLQSILD